MAVISFDLDGVLADTKRAVKEAYRVAGVIMPEAAWGKPIEDWLGPETLDDGSSLHLVHEAKQLHYPSMLRRYATPLAGTDVVKLLQAQGHKIIITTHASHTSAMDVLTWLQLDVPLFSTTHKARTLQHNLPACHVDDFWFEDCPVPFVHYIDDVNDLYDRVKEAIV
jgi:phosphoglycolate phosphatase-like HAD superfamily hydrolase